MHAFTSNPSKRPGLLLLLGMLLFFVGCRQLDRPDQTKVADELKPNLSGPVLYLKDATRQKSVAEVAREMEAAPAEWDAIKKPSYMREKLWLQLEVAPIAVPWVLSMSSRTPSEFEIWQLKGGQWESVSCVLIEMSPHPRCLMSPLAQPMRMMLAIRFSDTSRFQLFVDSTVAPRRDLTDEGILLNIVMLGISFALIFFLGIFGWGYRDLNYYFFALYASTAVIYSGLSAGMVMLLHLPYSVNSSMPFFGCLSIIFSCMFARHYLNAPKHAPFENALLLFSSAVAALHIVLRVTDLALFHTGVIIQGMGLFVLVVSISAGIKARRAGLRGMDSYLLAWGVFSFFIGLVILRQYGFLPATSFSSAFLRIGLTLALCILSVSVAKRAQLERAELMQQLQTSNHKLEEEVQARTRQILEQQQMMIQSAKLASLGEMAAGIAHEINNPLAIISGSGLIITKILAQKGVHDKRIEDFHQRLEGAIRRISGIVKSLRTLAHQGPKESMENVGIEPMISDISNLVSERFVSHGMAYRCDTPDASWIVRGHPGEVEQILINLLNNAYDAIAGSREAWVHISYESTGEALAIHITDSGHGIPPEVAEKIFDPFYTTKEIGKGTGLGLPLSKKLAQSMGGQLVYVLHEGHTRFTLTLTLAKPEEKQPALSEGERLAV